MFGTAALVGSALSAAGNYFSTKSTNKSNERIANLNNETAIELANTAHQREVEDLKKAGLNPILSAGGQGAATPALQQATMQAPQFNFDSMMNAVATMGNYQKSNAESKKLNIEAQLAPKIAEAQIELSRAQGDLAKQNKIKAKLESDIIEIQKKYYDDTGTAPTMSHWDRETKGIIKSIVNAGKALANWQEKNNYERYNRRNWNNKHFGDQPDNLWLKPLNIYRK